MTDENEQVRPETVAEFLQSFSYGSRNDLNFKFFKSIDEDAAKEFIRSLLDLLGDSYDSGELGPLVDLAIDAQIAGYRPDPDNPGKAAVHDDGPLTESDVPLADARVGLVTTSGHFVRGDDPEPFGVKSMTQREAIDRIGEFLRTEPTLSEIASDTSHENLMVRHGGYDITSAAIDPNVCFPIDVLADMRAAGTIGSVADTLFSFPGATAQGLLRKAVPSWIERFRREQIDLLLLVPV